MGHGGAARGLRPELRGMRVTRLGWCPLRLCVCGLQYSHLRVIPVCCQAGASPEASPENAAPRRLLLRAGLKPKLGLRGCSSSCSCGGCCGGRGCLLLSVQSGQQSLCIDTFCSRTQLQKITMQSLGTDAGMKDCAICVCCRATAPEQNPEKVGCRKPFVPLGFP